MKVKVHDHDCSLLIVHGVIMTNEGHLRLDEGTSGNAVTLIMCCQHNSKVAETLSSTRVLIRDH